MSIYIYIHIYIYIVFAYRHVSTDTNFLYVFLCLFAVCIYVCLSSSISKQNCETNINLILNNNPKRKPIEPVWLVWFNLLVTGPNESL